MQKGSGVPGILEAAGQSKVAVFSQGWSYGFESAGRTVLLIEGQVGVRSATGAILLAEGSFNT